ncbi:SAM-dependent methyltransferase [Bacillus ectoiniformans]|uniref:class I SAM-dependent DNA methyltransferase n=1 Tax=Bacillus ectoiniformans TaxID=1494429 RepID=UPI00195B9A57|nr:class I SAM-dependent methyltransferase [Bacillus ectoiniformans]MBM7649969.1 SAM-dependent methyltransferase [Bacillus ectoiniformans]
MTYQRFASVYDILMQDVPYDEWLNFFMRHAEGLEGKRVLDVGCGTGEFTVRLAEAQWDVTGIDLSDDMLMIAQMKASDKGLTLPLFQQDMREMEGLGEFDAVTIFCDSLNYLASEEDVVKTFHKVYDHLKPGGLFMFDVHSQYKMNHIFKDGTFTSADEEVSYIWNCFEGEEPDSVEHELTFFAFEETAGLYERFDEVHCQRTFSEGAYQSLLKATGFELLQVSADFTDQPSEETSERIFFVARK